MKSGACCHSIQTKFKGSCDAHCPWRSPCGMKKYCGKSISNHRVLGPLDDLRCREHGFNSCVEDSTRPGAMKPLNNSWSLHAPEPKFCGPQPCALLAGCQSTGTQEPTKRAFPAAMASPESTTGDPWPRGAAMFIPPQTRSREPRSWPAPISVLLTMPKPLTVWITINCGKCLHFMLNAEDSKFAFALKVCTVCSEKTDKSRSNIMSYTF